MAMLKRKRDDELIASTGHGASDDEEGFTPFVEEGGAPAADSVDLSLLEALEKEATHVVENLDARGAKKLLLSFEKKLKENLEARIKYAGQAEKFMESEVELDEEIKKLHMLAGAPELFPEIVRLNAVPSILSVLGHENSDLAMSAVSLLDDLTDEDAIGEYEEEAKGLVEAIVEANGLELLVQNMSRMDESDSEEAAAVFNTLSVVENMVEVMPEVAEAVCERTKLLKWLLTRIKPREFDSNKLYASEILAILLQSSAANQRRVVQINGVDALLQAVFIYKSREPKTLEEEETMENLFDAICSMVMLPENKEKFVKAEGVELMIILMKQKGSAYPSAVKVLDFVLTKCTAACDRFVESQGLKLLFGAFMGKVAVKRKSKSDAANLQREVEERVISIIATLFVWLSSGSRRDRLLSKFVESEHEKIDRTIELYQRYSERVEAEETRQQELQREEEQLSEEEQYLARLDAGLFTLQLIVMSLGHISIAGHSGMKERVDLLLKQRRISKDDLREVLQEYHDNIGDIDGEKMKKQQQGIVIQMINSL